MKTVAMMPNMPAGRITCFEQLAMHRDRHRHVVTMFSGGLDSTYLLLRLHWMGFTDIHAVAVDVG